MSRLDFGEILKQTQHAKSLFTKIFILSLSVVSDACFVLQNVHVYLSGSPLSHYGSPQLSLIVETVVFGPQRFVSFSPCECFVSFSGLSVKCEFFNRKSYFSSNFRSATERNVGSAGHLFYMSQYT